MPTTRPTTGPRPSTIAARPPLQAIPARRGPCPGYLRRADSRMAGAPAGGTRYPQALLRDAGQLVAGRLGVVEGDDEVMSGLVEVEEVVPVSAAFPASGGGLF